MSTVGDYAHVLAAFGLDPRSFRRESIYTFGPVFRGSHEGSEVVVKRTRSPVHVAEELVRWTGQLAARDIPVVTPIRTIIPNPVAVGDEVWVAYPFIHGDGYIGTHGQLRSAGKLLGAIHSASAVGPREQFARFSFPEIEPASTEEDLRSLRQLLDHHDVEDAGSLASRYERELGKLRDEYCPALRDVDLLRVIGPWDYKANNLVYTGETRPVLVDPDSSGYLPRLLDLALAAVLFHNELAQAPGRMFSSEEWTSFYDGYCEHVVLSSVELGLWPTALEFMRLEEGLWLALNDDEGWREDRQRAFLIDVLAADLERFAV